MSEANTPPPPDPTSDQPQPARFVRVPPAAPHPPRSDRPDPRRYIPPTRSVPDRAGKNERFLRDVLAMVTNNADARLHGQRFGEVVVRLTYVDGVITGARLMEETILKND